MGEVPLYRDTSLIRSCDPSWDHRRAMWKAYIRVLVGCPLHERNPVLTRHRDKET